MEFFTNQHFIEYKITAGIGPDEKVVLSVRATARIFFPFSFFNFKDAVAWISSRIT